MNKHVYTTTPAKTPLSMVLLGLVIFATLCYQLATY